MGSLNTSVQLQMFSISCMATRPRPIDFTTSPRWSNASFNPVPPTCYTCFSADSIFGTRAGLVNTILDTNIVHQQTTHRSTETKRVRAVDRRDGFHVPGSHRSWRENAALLPRTFFQ